MANSKLLKEAIADAKAVKETAIANAKIALEEAFTPKLQSILSKKLQAEIAEEEDDKEEVEEVEETVDSSKIGAGDNKEPEYDEAHTELDPETEKETAAPGEELDAVDKVDDLKEGEEEDEVEETVSEETEEVKEETEEVSEETEEVSEMGYKEDDDEDEMDEELNLEDIIKELESELSEEEGEDEEEVEELHGDKEGSHGEEEGSHGEEEMADMDEMEDEKEDDMDEDIDLDEILREMGYGEEEDEEEDMDESNESNQVEELTKELEEAYATVKELKSTINEVNLLNAKLLYANKLFRSYAMNNDQKSKVVETLDRTKSVREVKLVFATLAESMKFGGETKRKVRVTEGIASKPQASTAPKKEIISESNEIANRFKKLANIK